MAGTNSVDYVLNLKANVENAMKGIKGVQEGLKQLKLPKGFESSFDKSFDNLNGLIKKFNDQLNKGVKTKGDVTGLERITNQIDVEMNKISKDLKKLTGQEIHFKINTTEIKNAQKELDKAIEARNKFAASQADVKIGKSGKSANELLDKMSTVAGNSKTGNAVKAAKEALNAGDIKEYLKQLAYVERYYNLLKKGKEEIFTGISPGKAFDLLKGTISDSSSEMEAFNKKVASAEGVLKTAVANGARDAATQVQGLNDKFEKNKQVIEGAERAQEQLANQSQSLNQNIGQLESHVAMYFSFAAILRKVTQIARKAFQTVKELDAAMVETAVVTNFDVGDMWGMLPTYTENANALGSTIKDVYEAATLYYQQGLNTAQAMGLANETLKMARIGGLEAAEATDMMTAALRGFNMQINEMSAQKVNDVYSKLAAITASDTRELGSAMERTASIANSAGMAFETTTAFLAQMIETTREAPENLGTAMKTIVARFQEMKQDPTKLIDSEGEMLNANRVDAALKTIGVSLMDVNGQFRNLDDVFLEISSKWDGLTQTQQRYIATIAAGSRQQSRFIAMMQNYDRTMELVEAANNSNGASQEQFNKTLEGLDAKLNKLKNAWDQFAMGLANNKIIKLAVDGMTKFFTIINKILGILDNIPDPFGGLTKSLVTLLAVVKGMTLGGKILTGGVKGIGAFASGKATTPISGIKKGVRDQFTESRVAKGNAAAARRAAVLDARAYKTKLAQELKTVNFGTITAAARKYSSNGAMQLVNQMYPSGTITNAARAKALEITNKVLEAQKNHPFSNEHALTSIQKGLDRAGIDSSKIKVTADDLQRLNGIANQGQSAFMNFGKGVASTGGYLQTLGMLLSATPLAPFSSAVMMAGVALQALGGTLNAIPAKLIAMAAAEKGFAVSEMEGVAATEILSLAMAHLQATVAPLLIELAPFIAIFAALAGVAVLVYRAVTKNTRELNKAGQAAGAAADAYSSAAQATSELRDNLSQLEEAQAGFDGLVEGTAAFNEQLIKSNELVLQLLKKYPMLYEYLNTDSNGRMTISDAGMKAVLDYQTGITSQAAALNTLASGEYRAKQSEQEERDLIKERNEALRTFNGTLEEREKLIETYDKELELLDKQQDTYRQSSKATAVTTALSGKELNNQEAITQLYSDQYDLRKRNVDLTKEEAYKKYADFYGYDYRGGKLYDSDNNEVNVEKSDVISAAKEIEVLTEFEADADSLNDVINLANKYFKDNFNWNPFEGLNVQGQDTFISDILSRSADASEDAIQAILSDSSILEDMVDELPTDFIAGITGASLADVQSDLDGYTEKAINVLEEDIEAIAETQAQNVADLGIMIGKAYGDANVEWIETQLEGFSQHQRQTMLTAGKALEEAAGSESMETLIRGMTEIYQNGTFDEINQMEDLIEGVNWDNPIDRLSTYNALIESGTGVLEEWGDEFRKIGESSNLVTDAFQELYSSTDFLDAMEDLDKYTDGLGHIDASGVKDLSKEVGSLNKLLETGEITTGGMARTMNLLHDNADLTFLDINDDLIKLLNNLGQFDTLLGDAHNIIENFDPGLDTGEAGDFFVDSIEKYNELYENGEWGNPQMQAYAELIVGAKRFNDALKHNNGDLKKTYSQFNDIINDFAGGAYDAWERVANMTGGAADMFYKDSNGTFKIDLTGITSVEDVVDNLAEAGGYSRETAKMMLEFFSNYSPDFKSQMEAVAFTNTFNDDKGSYVRERLAENGDIVLLRSDLEKFALATGTNLENEEETNRLLNQIAGVVGKDYTKIRTIDDTSEGTKVEDVIADINKAFYGENAASDQWIQKYTEENNADSIDIQNAIDGLKDFNLTEEDAKEAVWQAFRDSEQDYYYKGDLLDRDTITSRDEFDAELEKITETDKWVDIGKAIAEGFLEHLKEQRELNEQNSKGSENGGKNGRESGGHRFGQSSDTKASEKTTYTRYDGSRDNTKDILNDENSTRFQRTTAAAHRGNDKDLSNIPVGVDTTTVQDQLKETWNKFKDFITGNPAEAKIEGNTKKAEEKYESFEDAIDNNPLVTSFNLDKNSLNETQEAIQSLNNQSVEVDTEIEETVDADVQPAEEKVDNFVTNTENLKPAITYNGIDAATAEVLKTDKFIRSLNPSITIKGDNREVYAKANGAFNYVKSLRPIMNLMARDNISPSAANIYNAWNGKILNWTLKMNVVYPDVQSFLKNAMNKNGGDLGMNFRVANAPNLTIASADLPTNLSTGGGSGGSGGSGGGGGGSDEKKHVTINNWSIQEALRHNYEKKIENYQHLVDNWMKKLDKSLERVSTKVSDVTGNINNQVDYLKSIKNQNDNLAKSYQISLDALTKGPYNVTISYDKNGESQQEDINLANYIYKDKWGNYQADTTKINQAGSQARKEAIFKAIDSALGPLVSGLQKAQDAAQDAQDAIDELYKKVYDTFYGWKNEITEIYNLSQKIAIDDAERSRLASHVNMELARIGAGFSDIPTAISNSIATIQRSNLTLMNQLETSRDMMAAQERELIRAGSFTSELEEYGNLWYKYGENNAATQEAKDIYLAVKRALTYVNISKNLDGTITYEIDWKGFEEAKENGEITEEAYEIMKDKLHNLEEQAKKMHEVIEDTDKKLTETYEAIINYKKEIADVEDKLIKQLEDNLKEQIDNTKKLSDAIKNALKNLLDEVKRKLDERRQKEDNEKTERDIANKQQRLALLRSSSAGNQVEIAQLEKEISDAQQSYQRTLEDQLLNKLQQQGDEAARQRERQIAIAQAQLDLSKSTNRELVNLWLSDPETYKDEIIKALLEADNYDEKGTYGQEVAEADANKTYVQLVTNLNQTNSEIEGTVANIAKKIEEFKKLLNDKLDNAFRGTNVLSDVIERTLSGDGTFTKALTSLQELLDHHLSAREISSVVKQENGGVLSAKALHDVGFTAKQAYDAGYGYDALKEAGYDLSEIRKAGYGAQYVLAHDNTVTPEDLRNAGYLAGDLYDIGYSYDALKEIGYDLSEMYKGYIPARTIVFNDESVTFEDLVKVGYKPSTVAAAFAALQKKKARENRQKTFKEAHTKRYATGGIADYTGPAWLDGTPTKPELVLNQQDTKNFLQLKDVLSSVMRGGAFDTPAAVGAGDMNYEININVDHIENDYDVDKIANRVKKIIVNDSSYRNVTAVRKFR